jgi:tetratricopeptide (TPR) repeat protein
MSVAAPPESFIACVCANLEYWRQTVSATPEAEFGALEEDWPNLLQAVRFGLALTQARPATAELALAAFDFVERHGYWEAWLPLLRALIEAWPDAPPRTRARLLDQCGSFLRLGQRPAEAVAAHTEAEALLRELDDPQQLARVHHALSEDYRVWRRYPEAERFGRLALEEFNQLGLAEVAGKGGAVLNTLGLIAYARGDHPQAEECLAKAVALGRTAQSPAILAQMLMNLAIVLEAQNKVEPALRAYLEASELLQPTRAELKKTMLQLSLGTLYYNQGRLAEAEAAFARADSPYLRASGHLYYQAVVANNRGNVLLAQKRFVEAEGQLRLAIHIWRQMDDELMRANTLGTLGEALSALGRPLEAIRAYDEALEVLARYPEEAMAKRLLVKLSAQREALANR